MQEHAIAIARVSAGKQREEDQRPELARYADGKGYILDAVIPVHGKSAFHGKHVKEVMAAVDKHVRHGEASVVIFRHVDRSSRQGAFEGYDLIKKIMDAGARVEFSAQEFLNNQKPGLLGLFFDMAQAESEVKRDRKLQGNAADRDNGELVGKAPWGYDIATVDGKRILAVNDLGRTWIPVIYQAAVDGRSLRQIQEMLTGIPSPQRNGVWNEASIRRVIANPTYHGGRVSKGNMEYEPLVTVELWQQANLAVEGRARKGRSAVKREPALARPYCGKCFGTMRDGAARNVKQPDGTMALVPSGKSPMYRVSRNGHDYYACKGHGPARKSCGAKLIPVPWLDESLDAAMTGDIRPYREPVYIPGDDKGERLAEIGEKIAAAARQRDYDLIGELNAQAKEIESQPGRKGRTEPRDTGMTIGQKWASLKSDADRRNFLITARVKVIAWLENDRVNILTDHGPGF